MRRFYQLLALAIHGAAGVMIARQAYVLNAETQVAFTIMAIIATIFFIGHCHHLADS